MPAVCAQQPLETHSSGLLPSTQNGPQRIAYGRCIERQVGGCIVFTQLGGKVALQVLCKVRAYHFALGISRGYQ
jgi:hypothetical protein